MQQIKAVSIGAVGNTMKWFVGVGFFCLFIVFLGVFLALHTAIECGL